MSDFVNKKSTGFNARYGLLYLPFLAAMALSGNAVSSYFIAWAGSFFIFYLTLTNKIRHTHADLPIAEKLLRPVFLTQLIFVGYMSCTSVFNFMDQLGYEFFTRVSYKVPDPYSINLTAACQRYYLLGHAAFAHGILAFYKDDINSQYKPVVNNWSLFFIKFGLIAGVVGFGFSRVSGLSILAGSVEGLAFVSSTIGFAISIPSRKLGLTALSGFIFASTLARALTSGYKEPVIVSFLMLGLFLYPFYKKLILTTFVPLMLLLFTVLPTYVNTFRGENWGSEKTDAESAKAAALDKVRENLKGDELAQTNWEFLTGRLSEIGLFTRYKEARDAAGEYYGFEIVAQTLVALVPRIFWSGKPLTEGLVMKRVIENGAVEEDANVSAKPQYIADAYMSFGVVGVWIFLFLYGAIAQLLCNKAERLFGGYFFGVAFVYTGMMSFLWRGNCFEFIFNSILYGFLGMLALHVILIRLNVMQPKKRTLVSNNADAGKSGSHPLVLQTK